MVKNRSTDDVLKLYDRRYVVCGEALRTRRERAGVSQTVFAEMCGWRPQYQHHLERTDNVTVGESAARVIEGVLNEIEAEAAAKNAADAARREKLFDDALNQPDD